VIVRQWREDDLQSIRWWLHGLPVTTGLVLAVTGIPFYDVMEYGCHISPPPDGPMWNVLVFAIIPIGFSVAIITFSMVYVYVHVRKHARASQKWSLKQKTKMNAAGKIKKNHKSSSSLETQVFWQAVLYTMSFYIAYPFLIAIHAFSANSDSNAFTLSATVAFLAPLQGFTNFLVYTRPRMVLWCRNKFTKRHRPSSSSHQPSQQHHHKSWMAALSGWMLQNSTSTSTSTMSHATSTPSNSTTIPNSYQGHEDHTETPSLFSSSIVVGGANINNKHQKNNNMVDPLSYHVPNDGRGDEEEHLDGYDDNNDCAKTIALLDPSAQIALRNQQIWNHRPDQRGRSRAAADPRGPPHEENEDEEKSGSFQTNPNSHHP